MMQCVIIDDEPLAREGLVNYIHQIDFLTLVGQGANPLELNEILANTKVDLVFMDIQMPIINGIDFLKITPNLPKIILTTAYPSYALEGFELDVIDYLLKPITFNRFLKAVTKAQNLQDLNESNSKPTTSSETTDKDHFFVKSDHKYEKVYYDQLLYVQAMQNYVTFHTSHGKIVSLLSLKQVEENLSDYGFIRVHKSYLVPVLKVDSIESHELMIGEHAIPIGRNYRKMVKDQVLGNKLWNQRRS